MMRRRNIVFALTLLLVLLLGWLLTTSSGLQWTYQRIASYLPAGISLENIDGQLSGPIAIGTIVYQQDGSVIRLDQIEFDWQPVALLTANIDIVRLHIQSLDIVLAKTEQAETTTTSETTLPEIQLPWRTLLNDVEVNNIRINQGEQHLKIDKINLKASSLLSKIDIETLSVSADTFSVNIQGELQPAKKYRHDLTVLWHSELASGESLEGYGKLIGDTDATKITQQINGAAHLTMDTQLNDLLRQLSWQTRIDVSQFDTKKIAAHLPALNGAMTLQGKGDRDTAAITGTLDGATPETGEFQARYDLHRLSDNGIQINKLQLSAARSETKIEMNGLWQPGDHGGDVKGTLNWTNLRWPLKDIPVFTSATGNASIEGTLDDYQIRFNSDSPWAEQLPSTWTGRAKGDRDGLQIQALNIDALDGAITASGQLSWSPVLKWQLDVAGKDINPVTLSPDWPGQIDVKLSSNGHIENEKVFADIDIREFSGTLRSYPVKLRSRATIRETKIDIAQFDFESGSSHATMHGQIDERLDLHWSIDTPDIAELLPHARGNLKADGRLSGPRHAPTIVSTFKGSSLRLDENSIGSLDGSLSIDLFAWQQLNINLVAERLLLKDYAMQSLNITSADQRIVANVVSRKMSAQIELQSITDKRGWHGVLEKTDVTSKEFKDWKLKSPVVIDISENTIDAQPLCLLNENSHLCMTLHRSDTKWQASLDGSQIPLALFTPWLPPDMTVEGKADATAEFSINKPETLLGHIDIKLAAGVISYPLIEGKRDRWNYQGGTVAIKLHEKAIDANADIAMNNDDHFRFKGSMPGAQLLTLDQQQAIAAQARLTIHDLGLLVALLPETQDIKGDMTFDLDASGTIAEPKLRGNAHLLKGELRIPRLGLKITDVEFNAGNKRSDIIDFQLKAHSGKGDLSITGETALDKKSGWATQINIAGENFEVSSIPEARVQISPELKVEINNRSVVVKGKVHVPYAKLQPKDITTASRVSDDAIIVGGEQPAAETWEQRAQVRVTLGDRVNFFGYGFEGRFGGNLLLDVEPGQLTRATGEINIPEGRYRAYGQRLDVEYGRLLYTGGPLTNPGLNIRAVRRIENITAGINVKGSFNQPQLDLFSIPAMGQTDALAYLMLGHPIEKASGEEGAMMAKATLAIKLTGSDTLVRSIGDRFGLDDMRVESDDTGEQASLVIGRYLSPKLYVSYGVGLVEAINTLALRYTITDKWQLKAESGEHQGADILYTIER